MDEVDRNILYFLIENSRISAKKIADNLNLHTNTVIKRIKRLEKEGVIRKYGTAVKYRKVGWDIHALIMAKVRGGVAGEKEQLENIVRLKEVEAVYATTGAFDVLILCRAKNRKHLFDLIRKIAENRIIVRTATQLILFNYKDPFDFNPFVKPRKQ